MIFIVFFLRFYIKFSTEPDLFNFAEPFIRYSIGDLGEIYNSQKCKCGDFRRVLSKLKGRDNDIINLCNENYRLGYKIMKNLAEKLASSLERTNRQVLKLTTVFSLILEN